MKSFDVLSVGDFYRFFVVFLVFSLRDDYMTAISGTRQHLVRRTAKNKFLFIGELISTTRDMKPKMVVFFFSTKPYCIAGNNNECIFLITIGFGIDAGSPYLLSWRNSGIGGSPRAFSRAHGSG